MWQFVSVFVILFLLDIKTPEAACVFNGVEYNAGEYAFLCKYNDTISERLVKEILTLNPSAKWDSDRFLQLAEEISDTMMVTFREDMAHVYMKYSCTSGLCHPHLLTERKPNVPENFPKQMEISELKITERIFLTEELSDLSLMATTNDDYYLTISYFTNKFLSFYRYRPIERHFQHVENLERFSGNRLTTSSWLPSMVIASTDYTDTYQVKLSNYSTPIYVFTVLKGKVEMMQAMEIKEPVSSVQVFFEKGLPSILALTNTGIGYQRVWHVNEFKLYTKTAWPPATHVTSFVIGDASFVVLSQFLPFKGFEPKGAHVYQSISEKPGDFKLYQRLYNCLVSTTEYFTFSHLHFLAVTCEDVRSSYIYWWSGSQFLLWQTIQVGERASWTAIKLINTEIVLALVEYSEIATIRFFQYEDNYFWPTKSELHFQMPRHNLKLTSFNYLDETFLIVNGKPLEYESSNPHKDVLNIYKIHLQPRQKETAMVVSNDAIARCLINVEAILDNENRRVNSYDAPPWNVMMTDREQTVFGETILVDGLFAKDVHVQEVTLHPTVVVAAQENFICNECVEIERNIDDQLRRLRTQLNDLVYNTDSQTVTGRKVFLKDVIVEDFLHSSTIISIPVCNVNWNDLERTTVRKFGYQVFNMSTTIYGHVTIENIDLNGLINGVNLNNVASVHGSKYFTKKQIFSQVITDNIQVSGTVNDINPKHIVVNDRPQIIIGEKRIEGNLVVKGTINLVDKYNKFDIVDIARNILTTDTFQIIDQKVEFEDLKVDTVEVGLINNHDLRRFHQNVLNTNEVQVIRNYAIFHSDVTMSSVHVNSKLNKINPHEFLTTDTNQILNFPVTIGGTVRINNLKLDTTINGIDWPADVVTTTNTQTITGRKYFDNLLTLTGSIELPRGGLVNGVDLSTLGLRSAIVHTDLEVDNLQVDFINGQSIWELLNIFRKSKRQSITGKYTFKEVEMHEIEVRGLIVNHIIEKDYITLTTEQIIEEEVEFDHEVKVTGSLFFKDGVLINGKDLSRINSAAVHVDGNYEIRGYKIFEQDVVVRDSIVVSPGVKINNIDISEHLLLTNKEQTIQNTFEAREIEVRDDITIRNLRTEFINNEIVDNFLNAVVYTRGDYVIRGVKTFEKNVNVHEQLNVHRVNDYDMNDLERRVVRLTTNQTITGQLIFKNVLHLQGYSQVNKVNGKYLAIEAGRLAQAKNKSVHTAIKFSDCVKFKKDIDVNVLNTFSLRTRFKNILSKTKVQLISYQKEIVDHVSIDNLLITEKIDGVFLREVVKTNEANKIFGNITFSNTLEINSDVTISSINNVNLNDLEKDAILKGTKRPITGVKTFKQIQVKELLVDKFVNQVNLTQLQNRLVLKNKNQTITGRVKFTKGLRVNKLESTTPINGINVTQMRLNAVMKHGEQVIIGTKKFITPERYDIHFHDNVEVLGSINHVRLIHGVDLHQVNRTALRDGVDQEITARKIFKNDVTFRKKVNVFKLNKLKLPDDVATVYGQQNVKGKVTIKSTTIKNLRVIGYINKVNLTRLINHRITLSTPQVIHRPVVFRESVTVTENLKISGNFNGLRCEDIVTLNTDQNIFGAKSFDHITAVDINTDYINGYHWLLLHNQIEQAVKKTWIHYEEVVFENRIILRGSWDNDVRVLAETLELQKKIFDLKLHHSQEIEEFQSWRRATNQCIKRMIPQIPLLAHHMDSMYWLKNFDPALDLAIFPFNGQIHLLLVVDPKSTKICHNVNFYTCLNSTSCDARPELTHDDALPWISEFARKTERIDVVILDQSLSFLIIWNGQENCVETLPGMHLIGIRGKSAFHIVSFSPTIDAMAIWPDYPTSLVAVANSKYDRLEIYNIDCSIYHDCKWQSSLHHVSLNGGKPTKLQWFIYNERAHLLVIMSHNLTTRASRVPSFIYEWDLYANKLEERHKFFAIAPADAATFTVNGTSYVVIGSYDCLNSMESDRLKVLQLSSISIETVQEIVLSTKALCVIKYNGDIYLAVASQDDDVYIYRWQGFFGFQLWTKIKIKKPQRISWYVDTANQLRIAIAGNGLHSHSVLVVGKS